MKEKNVIRFFILLYWTVFSGLTVTDKIIPAVKANWVGADFFTLFIKFFESLGIKNPVFATIALASIATIEVINFVFYMFSLINFVQGNIALSEKWFYRAIISSLLLFTVFSVGDNAFGDRSQLLEHGLFWIILLTSWAVFRYVAHSEEKILPFSFSKDLQVVLVAGVVFITITSISIINFSNDTYSNASTPVEGKEVVEGVYKFDMPFLADRTVLQETINSFTEQHPGLEVTYIYTAPPELNSKMKTYLLLYLFTEKRTSQKKE